MKCNGNGGALKDEQPTQDINKDLGKIGFHRSVVVCNIRFVLHTSTADGGF